MQDLMTSDNEGIHKVVKKLRDYCDVRASNTDGTSF